VEEGGAQHTLRARIAGVGGAGDERDRLLAAAVLEEQQAVIGGRLGMALAGGARIPLLGEGHVLRHAAAKEIGLGEIILGIGLAAIGERAPDLDRLVIILRGPGIDAGAYVARGGLGARR